jgi:hypothetical protein
VKPMMEKEQWTSVRPVLLDLQRLNPQNTEVKKLLREVQEKSRASRRRCSWQLLVEAEEAVLTQRYAEALEFYKQADALDREILSWPEDRTRSRIEGEGRQGCLSPGAVAGSSQAQRLHRRPVELIDKRASTRRAQYGSAQRTRKDCSGGGAGQPRNATPGVQRCRAKSSLPPGSIPKPFRACARRWRSIRQTRNPAAVSGSGRSPGGTAAAQDHRPDRCGDLGVHCIRRLRARAGADSTRAGSVFPARRCCCS